MKLIHVMVAAALVAAVGCKKKAAPRGPAPSWKATIGKDAYDAVGLKGGTLVAVGADGVKAWRDGTEVWRRALDGAPQGWLLSLADGNVLAGDDKGFVHALAAADGAPVWKVQVPADGDGNQPWVEHAARAGDRVVLLDAYNRFLVLEGQKLTPSGALKSGVDAESLTLMDDGTRVVATFGQVVLYSAAGERIGAFVADDIISGVAVADDGVVVSHDKGLAKLTPARCQMDVDSRVALASREGLMDAPAGCLEKLADEDNDGYRPAVSKAGLGYLADREVRGRGVKKWTATVDAVGHPVADGDTMYVSCWQEPADGEIFVTVADLCAVSLRDGKVKWRSRLGLRRAGIMDTPYIVDGADHLYVWLGEQVAAIKKPGA